MRQVGSAKRLSWGIGIVLFLLVSIIITGCARTKGDFVNLTADIYPPKSQAQEILVSQGDIDRPHKEIGIVKAKGNQYASENECFDKIRKIAREEGADAVIKAKLEVTERPVSRKVAVGKSRRTVTSKIKEPVCEGTAVVFVNQG